MKTLIVFDSYFDNTKKIAFAIGQAFLAAEVKVARIQDLTKDDLSGVELLIVGSPTRKFTYTGAVKHFLAGLDQGALKGVKVMAFDTRMDIKEVNNKLLTFLAGLFGYAAPPIAKKLVKRGGQLLKDPEGFFVAASEGPLKDGEEERAAKWARI